MAAPLAAEWLRRTEPREVPALSAEARKQMRLVARRTWRFFDTFVDAQDHYLPPDNYQEDPRGVLARRTSPTNIGLYLLSVVAARDFGFITLGEASRRLQTTLTTVEKLERRDGHVLNWYDTATLKPLEPQYVSTVDSGNLAAYLWTLRQACDDLARAPVVGRSVFEAVDDALALAILAKQTSTLAEARAHVAALAGDVTDEPASYVAALRAAHERVSHLREDDSDAHYWVEQARAVLEQTLAEVVAVCPLVDAVPTTVHLDDPRWRSLIAMLRGVRSISDVVAMQDQALETLVALEATTQDATTVGYLAELRQRFERNCETVVAHRDALEAIGARAAALADGMSFAFLYDDDRKLFAIGYNASNARLDGSHYDLLASEARLASLVAIAKGDAPQEHWFRMARPRTALSGKRRVLLSWSGSMFEYLMPLLVTKRFEGTLLDETYQSAVVRQMEYGAEHGVPWGVSESAFNVMDLAMTYQYRAFGVPGLGLKAGLGEDVVVAPYATALAALVTPDRASDNFRALEKRKALGAYGFYDAIDCTPSHLPPGRTSVVVKTFMAHHQGMTLVALDNALNGAPMQERFHRDARVRSCELLLEERVPTRAPLVELRAAALRAPVLNEPELDLVEHVGLGAHPLARLHLLGHGELSTAVSVLGEGFTTWRELDVYRFREETCHEAGGIYFYLRDRASGRTWSSAYQPTKVEPDFYDVAFAIDRVEISRRDGDIEATTEIAVSPERPAEVRRLTLTNHGTDVREIEVTTATEAVLAPRAADVAHRAFASMFLETEVLPERNVLLAHRRPRSSSEGETWLVQGLSVDGEGWAPEMEHGSSRPRFVGRGRTMTNPAGLHAPLSGTTGTVLDPLLAMRRTIRLEPGKHARLTLTTGLATSRAQAQELVDVFGTPHSIPRTFELAWADARVELKHLGVSAAQSHRFQRLLSAVVFPQHALRGTFERNAIHGRGRSGLWTHGLTSDLPVVVVHIDDPDFSGLFGEVLLAHEFWRLNGVTVDLVVVNEEPPGYMQPQHEALLSLVRSTQAAHRLDQRGGVFIRRLRDMTEEERARLRSDARVVLQASRGSLARQLRRLATEVVPLPRPLSPASAGAEDRPRGASCPTLAFDNGLGGFDADGAYVMRVRQDRLPPMPWVNVMANPHFGAMVTEGGAGVTWYANSQRHRLSPWSNDPVVDPSGELFFVRDEEDGRAWSVTPLPAGEEADYVVRHAQGWSSFEHTRRDLKQTLTTFVHPTDSVRVWRVVIENQGDKPRRLSLYAFVEWVLGNSRERSRVSIMTEWDSAVTALTAANPLSVYPERHAFLTVAGAEVRSYTGDREWRRSASRGRLASQCRSSARSSRVVRERASTPAGRCTRS